MLMLLNWAICFEARPFEMHKLDQILWHGDDNHDEARGQVKGTYLM